MIAAALFGGLSRALRAFGCREIDVPQLGGTQRTGVESGTSDHLLLVKHRSAATRGLHRPQIHQSRHPPHDPFNAVPALPSTEATRFTTLIRLEPAMNLMQPSKVMCAVLLALGSHAVIAKPGATGTVTIGGVSWPVVDAVATLDGENLELVFAQKPFDRAVWADDGKLGTFDLWDFKDNEARDAQSLTIDLDDADGSYAGHSVKTGSGSGGGFDSAYDNSVTLTARDDTHVAGTLKMGGGDLGAEISFDLVIEKFGPLARGGTPLPADGGEPGKALKAAVDATHSGDIEQMLAISHPANRKEIEDAKAAGETAQMLKMAQAFTPKITQITGGSIDGDKAWVEFEGQQGGREMKGTATLTRTDGKWYLKGMSDRK